MFSKIPIIIRTTGLSHAIMATFQQLNCKFAKLLLLLGLTSLFACQLGEKDRTDIKPYFLPSDLPEEGIFYEYHSLNDAALGPEYWHYQAFDSLGKRYIRSRLYRPDGSLAQEAVDFRAENGILQKSLTLFDQDSLGNTIEIKADIDHGNVFPFHVLDSNRVYLYKAEYTQPGDSILITLVRNRRYLGKDSITLFSRQYAVVHFRLKEMLQTTLEGSSETLWDGEEYWAEDTGLVYYRKEISHGFILEYGLHSIHSVPDFHQKMQWNQ